MHFFKSQIVSKALKNCSTLLCPDLVVEHIANEKLSEIDYKNN